MLVTVNGQSQETPDGETLRGLIERMGLDGKPCAAEVNRKLVPKREHEATRLKPGDHIELVTLVGGG